MASWGTTPQIIVGRRSNPSFIFCNKNKISYIKERKPALESPGGFLTLRHPQQTTPVVQVRKTNVPWRIFDRILLTKLETFLAGFYTGSEVLPEPPEAITDRINSHVRELEAARRMAKEPKTEKALFEAQELTRQEEIDRLEKEKFQLVTELEKEKKKGFFDRLREMFTRDV